MTGSPPAVPYDADAEQRLRDFVERVKGAKVIRMERMVRWRPAWFVDVERNGAISHLHLRGDREGDVSIFPDLKREADIIDILAEHGVPCPAFTAIAPIRRPF